MAYARIDRPAPVSRRQAEPIDYEAFTLENAVALLGGNFTRVEVERADAHLRVTEVEPLIAYVESMGTIDQVRDSIAARLAAGRALCISKDSGLVTAVGWLPGG